MPSPRVRMYDEVASLRSRWLHLWSAAAHCSLRPRGIAPDGRAGCSMSISATPLRSRIAACSVADSQARVKSRVSRWKARERQQEEVPSRSATPSVLCPTSEPETVPAFARRIHRVRARVRLLSRSMLGAAKCSGGLCSASRSTLNGDRCDQLSVGLPRRGGRAGKYL